MIPDLEVERLIQGVEILGGPIDEGVCQFGKSIQRCRDFVEVGWRCCELGLSLIGVGLPAGDHVFELADAGGDLASGSGRDVVGFQVEYLALESPVEIGDFAVDLCQPGGCRRAAIVPVGLGGVEAFSPVAEAVLAEDRVGQPCGDGFVERFLCQVDGGWVFYGDVGRPCLAGVVEVVAAAGVAADAAGHAEIADVAAQPAPVEVVGAWLAPLGLFLVADRWSA